MAMISMEEVLAITCPLCKAAPTAKCLDNKVGGMGGMNWIENPHPERIKLAILKKQEQDLEKDKEAA